MAVVSRLDSDRTHGFQAKVHKSCGECNRSWCSCHEQRSKFFADLKHGGRDRAREACHRWIEAARSELARRGVTSYQEAVRDKGRVRRILAAMKSDTVTRAR